MLMTLITINLTAAEQFGTAPIDTYRVDGVVAQYCHVDAVIQSQA